MWRLRLIGGPMPPTIIERESDEVQPSIRLSVRRTLDVLPGSIWKQSKRGNTTISRMGHIWRLKRRLRYTPRYSTGLRREDSSISHSLLWTTRMTPSCSSCVSRDSKRHTVWDHVSTSHKEKSWLSLNRHMTTLMRHSPESRDISCATDHSRKWALSSWIYTHTLSQSMT